MPIAIMMDAYGPPDVLRPRDVPVHEPSVGEIVVRVTTAGINRADAFIRSGAWPQSGGWPYVPGLEACGVVESVGDGVEGFAAGDPVITMMQKLGGIHGTRPGGYQDFVKVPASTLVRLPRSLTPEVAGALGLAAVTANQALDVLDVRAGMRVLVHGGSSGVGTMALQMIRAKGARSIATTTREEKFELMRRAGADETISTRERDWSKRAAPVDRVFDLVGSATFRETLPLLVSEGRYLFVGGTSGADLALDGWQLMRPITLTGYSSETLTQPELGQSIQTIARLYEARALAVTELHEFPLVEASRAHEAMESGRLGGRIVLRA
jgi:NADPH2:quinone reductase